jgi:hypothetical protein
MVWQVVDITGIVLIEQICYNFVTVVQSQTETIRTLTSEECRPASRIAAP